MRIYVDDKPLAPDAMPAETTLAAALNAVGAAFADRLIVEAMADGAAVPQQDLDQPPENHPYAQELRFRTADPELLVRETLFDASDALQAIRETQQRCAALIQTGDNQTALAELGRVVGVWDQVNRAWELSRAAGAGTWASPEAVSEAAGADIEAATGHLNDSLRDLQRALLAMDWSELADVLAFEMDEQAAAWSEMMSRLAGRLGAAATTTG